MEDMQNAMGGQGITDEVHAAGRQLSLISLEKLTET